MRAVARLVFILLFPVVSVFAESKPTLVIAADRWCPINCDPDSEHPGFMIEIAREVFEDAGYRIDYRLMPWARAIRAAREGVVNGIVGAYPTDAPDFVFPALEQGSISPATFFTRASSSWEFRDLESLTGVRLGTILHYSYGELMDGYVDRNSDTFRVQEMSGNDPLRNNIRKLLIGRIDVIVEAAPVFLHRAAEMGVSEKIREAGSATPDNDAYIAFSPELEESELYARILSKGVSSLRHSGRLEEIMQRYGLHDWRS